MADSPVRILQLAQPATRIIATVGPASAAPDRLQELVEAGVDLFRFNYAHGSAAEHARNMLLVRKLGEQAGRHVGTLADIPGPKIRLGTLPEDPSELREGAEILLHGPDREGPGWVVSLENFHDYVAPEDPIYLADGTRRLRAIESRDGFVRARVEVGGPVSSHKGVNLPRLRQPLPAVGEEDAIHIGHALLAGADWIGLSFVARAADLEPAHRLMRRLGVWRPVLAKLERPAALEQLNEILAAFDGVMIARGDLGIEVDFEKVPGIQDRILRAAQEHGKPAVVATQILTSMIHSPRPTRAEVTDIVYAVRGGADALMLSEETAIGDYPVQVVETMVRVAREAERTTRPRSSPDHEFAVSEGMALAQAAVQLAERIRAAAILCPTHSGRVAHALARCRPRVPVVVLTDSPGLVSELLLYRGLHPRLTSINDAPDTRLAAAIAHAQRVDGARPGSRFVIIAGVPAGSEQANLLMIHTTDDAL